MSVSTPVTEPNILARSKTKTRVIKIKEGAFAEGALADALEILQRGGVIALPTDTVYGLACNAFNPEGIRKIYAMKGRAYTKALPVFLSDPSQLGFIANDVPAEAHALIERFWPGPLTLVFKTAPMALHATRGKSTIAVRIPDHGAIRVLLENVGVPLVVTSANHSGAASTTSAGQVKKIFSGQVELIFDGGACKIGRESTVVDATHYPFTVLRPGAVSKADLEAVLKI